MRSILWPIASPFLLLISAVNAELTHNEFHVCTVASENTIGLSRLRDSCAHFDIQLDILGMGLPYQSNVQKLIYINEYLTNIPDDHVVMYVDGYDTLILADKQKILHKFLKKKTNCLFASTTMLHPPENRDLRTQFPKSPTKFKYLNAGTFIGYAGYLKKMLDALKPFNIEVYSDQGFVQRYYLNHQNEIALDYNCDIFLCSFVKITKEELVLNKAKKSVHFLTTQSKPCIIHGNGKQGKNLYRWICYKFFPNCLKGKETTVVNPGGGNPV